MIMALGKTNKAVIDSVTRIQTGDCLFQVTTCTFLADGHDLYTRSSATAILLTTVRYAILKCLLSISKPFLAWK